MINHRESTCWICGGRADTSEHRIKKVDIVRAHGRGPYQGPSALVHVQSGAATPIQGPRAEQLKYSPSLCGRCNSAVTQPYDKSYDHFVSWVLANEDRVLKRRFIDFAEVYGSEFETAQRDLFKYFVKSFGCRLVASGASVPADLVTLLPRRSFRTGLKITLCVNEDILLLPESIRSGFLGKGALIKWKPRSDLSTPDGYTWNEHVSWLTACYWYGSDPEGQLGSTWIANAQYLYLGSLEPLSPEQRIGLIEKIRDDPVSKKDN